MATGYSIESMISTPKEGNTMAQSARLLNLARRVKQLRGRGYEIAQILRRGVIMQRESDGKSAVLNRNGDLITTVQKVA